MTMVQTQSVSSMTCEPDTDSAEYQQDSNVGKSPKKEVSGLNEDFSPSLLGVGGQFE
jgi:hypothetical protein